MTRQAKDRGAIATEQSNPRSVHLHQLSIAECVELITLEDRTVYDALKQSRKKLSAFLEEAEPSFLLGGRLIYIGAGTSGRLGVLDASEIPPTFHVEPSRIVGLIAGGQRALTESVEGAEDDRNGAVEALQKLKLQDNDILLGITAGGTTPYVLGALDYAHANKPKALTGLLSCADLPARPSIKHYIILRTGPEILSGSTRLKAGTATKLSLNIISTTLMLRAGHVYKNLMVNVRVSNEKLEDRATRILMELTGLQRELAFPLLHAANKRVKTAVLMHHSQLSREEAEHELLKHKGYLDRVLHKPHPPQMENTTLVIDGGATKTCLSLINENKDLLKEITLGPSNPHTVPWKEIHRQLQEGIAEIIGREPNKTITVIAGFAGLRGDEEHAHFTQIFREMGFAKKQLHLQSDLELLLQVIPEEGGILLIAGTGSSCVGKLGSTVQKAGGLGHVLGDDGSGYAVGCQALKASLAAETGWGPNTILLPMLRQELKTSTLSSILPDINRGRLAKNTLAALAIAVYRALETGDRVAIRIAEKAAHEQGVLVDTVKQLLSLDNCPIYLVGGLFKQAHAESLLQQVLRGSKESLYNLVYKKPSLLAAKKLLDGKSQSTTPP